MSVTEDEDLFDPDRPTLEAHTDAGHAFMVPWSHEVRAILAGFESGDMRNVKGPWKLESPFSATSLRTSVILSDRGDGAVSYQESFTDKSSSSTSHLSIEGAVSVGYPFLKAGAAVKYDKTVIENENSTQASRKSSCRVGRVILDRAPTLSDAALELLQAPSGVDAFRKLYGDYYICGYELGADAAITVSGWTWSKEQSESLEVTVSVKVLFVTVSASWSKDWCSADSAACFTVCGYSTIDGQNNKVDMKDNSRQSQANLGRVAKEYLDKVASLDARVEEVLNTLGLHDGKTLPLSSASQLCRSGLVVRLLLAPYARLNQFVINASRRPQLKKAEKERLGLPGRESAPLRA